MFLTCILCIVQQKGKHRLRRTTLHLWHSEWSRQSMRILFRSKLWRHPWSFCFPRLLTKGLVWKAGTICIHIHTYIHTCTCTRTHTQIHVYMYPQIQTCKDRSNQGGRRDAWIFFEIWCLSAQSAITCARVCVCAREREHAQRSNSNLLEYMQWRFWNFLVFFGFFFLSRALSNRAWMQWIVTWLTTCV